MRATTLLNNHTQLFCIVVQKVVVKDIANLQAIYNAVFHTLGTTSDKIAVAQRTSSVLYKMSARNILLLSSSRLHGYGYLEHARSQLDELFKAKNVQKVLFVPYALKDHDKYTATVRAALQPWGYEVEGLHTKSDRQKAIEEAQALFVGGGNTFVLLRTLYELKLLQPIREQVLQRGLIYVGSSAGTNVATRSIHTTNDMPVAHPPSFDALALVPFNINPHYLEMDENAEHKGETRDERLQEFVAYHQQPVLGLREGTSLRVQGNKAVLLGLRSAKLFKPDGTTLEYEPQSDLSFLLENEPSV